MPNSSRHRSVASGAAIAIATIALATACGTPTDDKGRGASPSSGSANATSGQSSSLADVNARDLIGMSGNEVLNRIFIKKYWGVTPMGDGWVRDFGGVRFSTEQLNLVNPLVPEKAEQHQTITGDSRVVTACVTHDASGNSYGLHLGVLPIDLVTDEILDRGRNGEYREIMDRNTSCRSWGPPLPLSRMK